MRRLIFSSAAAVLFLAFAPAGAQEPGSRPTREFVQAAAQSDQFEILEGHVAATQSTDPQVRAFALQMIEDHRTTSATLRDAAARGGLSAPPMSLSGDQARLLSALQSLRGPEFDQAYARHQVLAHRSALVVEYAYAASGDNPALRQVAASTAPLVASHLAMAEQLRAKLGGS